MPHFFGIDLLLKEPGAAKELPASQNKAWNPSPRTVEECFRHNIATVERLYQSNGLEGIKRLRDNLSKVSLVSLFSGLGGAELLMQNIFAGVEAVAPDLGLERPLQPRNLPLIFPAFPFCAVNSIFF